MNTWWIRKKWETNNTRVQEIKHQKGAARVPARLHRNSARVKSPEQLINAAKWNLDIDSERFSCCSRSWCENVVESASAWHQCTLRRSRSLCRSHQTLPPWFWCQIYFFLLCTTTLAVRSAHRASTSGCGAMATDPNRSPTDSWKGPARQQRRPLSLDKRSPRPRPLRLM